MTMHKILPVFVIGGVLVIAGWLAWGSIDPASISPLATTTGSVTTTAPEVNAYECNGDAKICPDGSTVGRTGLQCEFASCPDPTATSATIRTTIGQVMTGLSVSITPHAVIDDSRCPTDVQCIWAGTVFVQATIKTPTSSSEEKLEIGKAITKDGYTITFTELTPAAKSGQTIPDSSYRFVFIVAKK